MVVVYCVGVSLQELKEVDEFPTDGDQRGSKMRHLSSQDGRRSTCGWSRWVEEGCAGILQ